MHRLVTSIVLCLLLVGSSSRLGAQQASPPLPTEQAAPSQDQAELQGKISELEKQVRELTEQVRVLESRALDTLLKNGKAIDGTGTPKMERFFLKNVKAEYVRPIVQRLLLEGERPLNAKIMSDARTNSILAKGLPEELAIIGALVKRFE